MTNAAFCAAPTFGKVPPRKINKENSIYNLSRIILNCATIEKMFESLLQNVMKRSKQQKEDRLSRSPSSTQNPILSKGKVVFRLASVAVEGNFKMMDGNGEKRY